MTYGFEVVWSAEDEEYVATCPSFPSFSAFGETPEEAISEALPALALLIEEYESQEAPLPEPEHLASHSGQFRQRLSRSLHSALARRAASEGVSQNSLVAQFVAEGLAGHSFRDDVAMAVQEAAAPIRNDLSEVLNCMHGLEDGHHLVAQDLHGIAERLSFYAVPEPAEPPEMAGSYDSVLRQVEGSSSRNRVSFADTSQK